MRLSEAIISGAKMSPQGFKAFISYDGSRCAFGAADQAMGCALYGVLNSITSIDREHAEYILAKRNWLWVTNTMVNCPQCGINDRADSIIIHMNDRHRLSREYIGQFVASIESQQEQALLGTARLTVEQRVEEVVLV